MKKKIAIIGGGPAGYTAAIYLGRAGYECDMFISDQVPTQISLANVIDNYPGICSANPDDILDNLKRQIEPYSVNIRDIHIEEFGLLCRPDKKNPKFSLCGYFEYDGIVICVGASHRKLEQPPLEQFGGIGVSYCAICDGFLFKDQEVMVVGGGDTALSDALYLSNICKKVYLVHRRNEFRASKELQDKVAFIENTSKKIEVIFDAVIGQVFANKDDGSVCSVELLKKYNNNVFGWRILNSEKMAKSVMVTGVFVAIGQVPNTKTFKNIIDMDENGYIVDHGYGKTNIRGVVAAGDCLNYKHKQIVTACASACNAAMTLDEQLR